MSQNRLEDLFNLCLTQRATAQEKQELHTLLENAENEEQIRSHITQLLESPKELEDISADTMQSIMAAIFESEDRPIPVPRVQLFKRSWFRYAAAILIIALAAGTYFWQPAPRKISPPLTQDVNPGNSKAILTLGDGSTVTLDSAGNRMIGQGIRQQGDQLQYEVVEAVSYNTLRTPRGGQFRIQLPDGTKAWLNAESSLTYPTAFPDDERNVEISGEVYFEVAKQAQAPFKVKVNNQTSIEVLGTHFNINAYRDEDYIRTTLLEGAVRVNAGTEKVVLAPGQQAQISNKGILVLSNTDLDKTMAWKNGFFNFQDAHLKEVMRQLARWYDIDISYEGNVPDIEFGGKMSRNIKLSDVLKGLKGAGVQFRMEEGPKLIVTP
ncbi:FecR family protein [Chitinophaga niabensis]|uniref:FecR protein n=1 Tax=Chitinophaga niabensis TaxID=536979 RepID=A0A1N6GZK4_9BACT|nr:FecR family protein [Chitinophaga niabensis]SIO12872.1 protein of unknown function [Chitinophaga niabensis]